MNERKILEQIETEAIRAAQPETIDDFRRIADELTERAPDEEPGAPVIRSEEYKAEDGKYYVIFFAPDIKQNRLPGRPPFGMSAQVSILEENPEKNFATTIYELNQAGEVRGYNTIVPQLAIEHINQKENPKLAAVAAAVFRDYISSEQQAQETMQAAGVSDEELKNLVAILQKFKRKS